MSTNKELTSCDFCDYCYYCDFCYYCYYCDSCDYCDSCYSCYYSKGLRMSERMIFCLGGGKHERIGDGFQKYNMAFNKQVTEERFSEIKKLIKYDILKDLKLELNKEDWSDEWKKVTTEQWRRISEIPEFDKKVVEGIIGFELDLNEVEEMTVDQVCKELGRDIKIVK